MKSSPPGSSADQEPLHLTAKQQGACLILLQVSISQYSVPVYQENSLICLLIYVASLSQCENTPKSEVPF